MIAIIDYDAGNLKSVEKALQHLSYECKITRDAKEILKADRVILPGVGAFGDAMEKLKKYGLVEIIKQVIEKKTPFFKGLKAEFNKIIWPDKTTLTKQTAAVVVVSVILGAIITICDILVKFGVDLLVR